MDYLDKKLKVTVGVVTPNGDSDGSFRWRVVGIVQGITAVPKIVQASTIVTVPLSSVVIASCSPQVPWPVDFARKPIRVFLLSSRRTVWLLAVGISHQVRTHRIRWPWRVIWPGEILRTFRGGVRHLYVVQAQDRMNDAHELRGNRRIAIVGVI